MPRNIRKVKGYIAVTVAVLIVLITACLLFFILCRADKIVVEGCELYDDEEIITASGIEKGTFLFSVDKDAASDKILHICSVVREVDVSVRLPDRVVITVIEEPPLFYTQIGVSTVMFNYELRVAEVKQNSSEGTGIKVILPEITTAIGGERIEFSNGEPTYIVKFLEAVSKAELLSRITEIDCRNARGASVLVDGKYTLITGGVSDLDLKFNVACEYLNNERLAGAKSAVLDLTSPKEVIVTIND